jgi:hypothetical protein
MGAMRTLSCGVAENRSGSGAVAPGGALSATTAIIFLKRDCDHIRQHHDMRWSADGTSWRAFKMRYLIGIAVAFSLLAGGADALAGLSSDRPAPPASKAAPAKSDPAAGQRSGRSCTSTHAECVQMSMPYGPRWINNCARLRSVCMQTGRWNSGLRNYSNVARR